MQAWELQVRGSEAYVQPRGRLRSARAALSVSDRDMSEAKTLLDPTLRGRMERNLKSFERRSLDAPGLRRAAVAIVVVAGECGQPAFLLTRRASGLADHPGQFALPGGRIESGESAAEAACRETEEEVGLSLAGEALLGRLDDYRTRSGFVISPFVAWGGLAPDVEGNPAEVAVVYRVPLTDLDEESIPVLRKIPESDRPVLSLPLCDTQVHAPTAAVLYQFREVALRGGSIRVDGFEEPVWAWK
jgi:8-oxo-dGTP pyrophosphatase MutT (NUDIX family)